jgi:hypothetical protein
MKTVVLLFPTHLQAHFIFFADTQDNAKKIKRACKPPHSDSVDIRAIMTQLTYGRKEERTDNRVGRPASKN